MGATRTREVDRKDDDSEDIGYGASEQGDLENAPDQEQPGLREPPSPEEAELDDYGESEGDA